MILAMFLVVAASLANQPDGKAPGPVAKVMHWQGGVVLIRDGKNLGKVRLLQELIENDQLLLEAKAELILDFRADLREQIGAKERKLTEKITLTVRAKGCEPAKAMERIKIKSYAGQFKNLQALPMGSRAGRTAGSEFRSKDLPDMPPAVQPMWGAKLLQPRPDFSWQGHPKAAGYGFSVTFSSLPGPVNDARPRLFGSAAFISTSGGICIGSITSGATVCQSTMMRLRIACV